MGKHTIAELHKVRRDYHNNFKRLLKSVGTPEHSEYLKIERVLFIKEVLIRRSFGKNHKWRLASDPCTQNKSVKGICSFCTGYLKKVPKGKTKTGKERNPWIVNANRGEEDSYRCQDRVVN